MQRKEVEIQAKQFLGYFSRLKDRNIEDVFRFWSEGKDFDEETKMSIRMEVDKILIQRRQG